MTGSTQRFSNRVDNYTKYRPGYPPEVIQKLRDAGNLSSRSVIADVGSGTGIFTRLLLEEDYTVYAVEPNQPMREVADRDLSSNPKYHSVSGTAEATTLAKNSVNMIVCAQAFHWFDAQKTQVEFARIIKPGGKVALIWNNRQIEVDEFAINYELLLREQGSDYNRVNHQNLTAADFSAFFKNGDYELNRYYNQQVFDEAGLIGRAFSSSYVPAQETPDGQSFLTALKELFNRHQENGKVTVWYQTEVYLGEV